MARTPVIVATLACLALATLTLPLSGSSGAAIASNELEKRDLDQIEFDVRKVRQNVASIERRLDQPIGVVLKEERRGDPKMVEISSKLDQLNASLQRIEQALAREEQAEPWSASSELVREAAIASLRRSSTLYPVLGNDAALTGSGRVLLHSVFCDGGVALLLDANGSLIAPVSSHVAGLGQELGGQVKYEGIQQFELGVVVELPLVARRESQTPQVTLIYTPID